MKILMCTDGSKFAEDAIRMGGRLLECTKNDVTLLRVIPTIAEEYKEYEEYYRVFKDEIHMLRKLGVPKAATLSLEKGKEILKEFGIKAKVKTRKGKAVDEILEETEEGYDLIILASYGKGISKFMLGSVSREIVHRANIPVLVVKGKNTKKM